jgi:hypothetical protein
MDAGVVEIYFDGDVADLIRSVVPNADVRGGLTCTTLWQQRACATDLDRLLTELSQFGITPVDVHRGVADDEKPSDCEVVIQGRLGQALLHHLGWSHRVSPVTVVRLLSARVTVLLGALGTRANVRYLLCE